MQNQVSVKMFQFEGDRIATFEVEGVPYVAMRRIVDNLGLSWGGQRDKLNAQPQKFNCTDISTVAEDGKIRGMLSIPVSKLPLWLACINPNKIKDKVKRAKVEVYQEKSAQALHDFWNQGLAVRDDYAGLVTDLDPKVMQALGGMFKGIVHKSLTDILPAMVEHAMAEREIGIVHGLTAYDVSEMAGVTDRKGLRGLGNFISHRLRRYHAEKGVAVKIRDYGNMVSVLVYDKMTCKEWLAEGGKQAIKEYVAERRGQTRLKLVSTQEPS